MKNEIIAVQVGTDEIGANAIGDVVPTIVYKEVFAEKKSVKQSEFYQAHSQGLKPEFVLVIHPSEYEGMQGIRYQGKEYRVIRTYEKDSENLELTCEGDFDGRT